MNFDSNDVIILVSIVKKINFMDELVRHVYDINLISSNEYKIKYGVSDKLYDKFIKIKNNCGIQTLYLIYSHVYHELKKAYS